MRRVYCALVAAAMASSVFGQIETYDLATFRRPAGWNRTESNGMLILQTRKVVFGREEFCQIYLFRSRASKGDAMQDFQTEWHDRIAGPLGIAAQASPTREQTPDGWTVFSAYTDFVKQRAPVRAVLATAMGYERVVSAVVLVSPNSYVKEVGEFFRNLNFSKPAGESAAPQLAVGSTTAPAGPSAGGSPGDYVFRAPNQWTRQEMRDRIVLASPVYQNGERCQITMLPLHAAPARPMGELAVGTFREIFRANPLETYPSPPPRLASGISPAGWEYFTIRKLVGGQEGDGRGVGTILLMAKIGDQIATMYGVSKDFIVSNCFGELVRDEWPNFFYGLEFKNAQTSPQQQAAIRQRLAGTWITATGTVGDRYVFRADGRYEGAGATRHVNAISPTQVLETTTAFFGNGSYSLNGNTIVLTGDDQTRRTFFFRVEAMSRDAGRTWADELCMLSPGASGEVCYRKQ